MKTMDFNTKNGRNLNDLGYPYFSKPHQILYPPVTQHRHGQIQLLQARKMIDILDFTCGCLDD